MSKKRLVVILLLVAFAISVLAIGSTIAQKPDRQGQIEVSSPSGIKPKPGDLDRTTTPEPAQTNPLAGQPVPTPESQEVPQYVVYGQVFRHIKELHRKADE